MNKQTKQFAEQVYYSEIIPDRTEELLKLSQEARIREHQESQNRQDLRNKEKSDRINSATEDKYLHALKLITEHAEAGYNPKNLENGNDPTTVTIPYDFFNFENHIKRRDLLEAFLFKLKKAGCFENFNRSPTTPLGFSMIFYKVDVEKLKRYSANADANLMKISGQLNILKFDGLWLELETGRGGFREKPHRFNPGKVPYKVLRLLLERKNDSNSKDGEVTREEFIQTTGINDWEKIKQTVRGMRRSLEISRKINPNRDPFQDIVNGYRLVEPL